MTVRSWIHQLFTRPRRRSSEGSRKATTRCRPSVEFLEDRIVLKNYNPVTTLQLIDAIADSNSHPGSNTITLSTPVYNLTDVKPSAYGPNGLPVIAAGNNLTIEGMGNSIGRSTAPGTPAFRIMAVEAGATLKLQDLTLQNGLAAGSGVSAQGGAIYSLGTLTLDRAIIQNSRAQGTDGVSSGTNGGDGNDAYGGALFVAGGVATLTGTTLRGNSAQGGNGGNAGGAGSAPGGTGGGAAGGSLYVAGGTVGLNATTLSNNIARAGNGGMGTGPQGGGRPGGDASGGGLAVAGGSVTLAATTLQNNSAESGSGGLGGDGRRARHGIATGGGLYLARLTMTANNLTLSGNTADRGGGIESLGTLTLTNSTVTGNSALSTDADNYDPAVAGGGGITNLGTLTLVNCALSGNSATFDGGGIHNAGTATLENCTVSDNSAKENRGPLSFANLYFGGGGIMNNGEMTINKSSLTGNSATDRAAGGGISNVGTLKINGSTLSGNSVPGIYGGGGITNNGPLTVTNSTLSANSTKNVGGGMLIWGGVVIIANSTLSGNSATPVNTPGVGLVGGKGGGIYSFGGTLTVNNSIVANSPSGGDIGGPFTGSNNLTGTVALGPLQDNGGPTLTFALPPGSPAINAGKNSLVPTGVTTDQRGSGFDRIVGGTVDIGAFEAPNQAPTGIALTGTTVAENQSANTLVGTFNTTDSDAGGTFPYELVSGPGDTDNASFTIEGNQLKTAASFDFEGQRFYSIRVKSTDAGGLAVEEVFTISVTDVNEVPTAIALSASTIAENLSSGTVVGSFQATDPDNGDSFTYSLVSGTGDTDNAAFTIEGDQLKTATTFDFEGPKVYSIRVRATDASGLFTEKDFTINVSNVNEVPAVAVPGSQTAYEDVDLPIGDPRQRITVGDPDGDGLTVTLAVGRGTLTLGTTTGLSVTGNGGSSVTLTGSVAEINAALATLAYRGGRNYAGPDSLAVTATDGSLTAAGTVALQVRSAARQAAELRARVDALRDAGVLGGNKAGELTAKLSLRGDARDADRVRDFLGRVAAFRAAGVLTRAQADALLGAGDLLLLGVRRR